MKKVRLGEAGFSDEVMKSGHPDVSMMHSPLTLLTLDGAFAICRLEPQTPTPLWATASAFFSITRTADELSIVCPEELVPVGIPCERVWPCLRVAGTIPFSVVDVLASLTAPLADAGISVFAISTFDTDYLLIKAKDLARAVDILRRQGHKWN